MLNPDGVIVGNTRCSLAARDLNRQYKSVIKEAFPPVYHVKTMIRK
jgi:spermidine synthase